MSVASLSLFTTFMVNC